jgi:hypothetical protein
MFKLLNKTFDKEARYRSNSKPPKGTPNTQSANQTVKGVSMLITKPKVHSGIPKMEVDAKSRSFSGCNSPASPTMKCSSPVSTKASSNGSGVRKHVSGVT